MWRGVQENNPERLALTDKMKREGAAVLRMEVLRLRMEANIGKAPPLTDEEVFVRAPSTMPPRRVCVSLSPRPDGHACQSHL